MMSHPVTTQNTAAGYVLYVVRLFFGVTYNVFFGRVLPDALAELKALANIIQSSVEQIEAAVTANSFTFPSPDSTFSLETEAPRMHPAILSAGSLITSAATQLITLVRPAPLTLLDTTLQVTLNDLSLPWIIANNVGISKFHICTAMRTVISMHVAEILRDAGPKVMLCPTIDSKLYPTFVVQGKHVAEIVKPTKANPGKLGRYKGEYHTIR
jgi:hypothetical protein